MPITTKQDVQLFGANVVNTLNAWGQQIQNARDIESLNKINNVLSDVNKLTTNKDGSPKSQMQIGADLFKLQNQANMTIANPLLVQGVNKSLGEMYKTILGGMQTQEQKRQDVGEMVYAGDIKPKEATQVLNYGQPSLSKVGDGLSSKDKYTMGKGFWRIKAGDNTMNEYVIPTYNKTKDIIGWNIGGEAPINDLNAQQKIELEHDKMLNQIKVAATPRRSSVYHSGPETFTPVQGKDGKTYFSGSYGNVKDETGKVMSKSERQGLGLDFKLGATSQSQLDSKSKVKQQTAWDNVKKLLPSVGLKGTDANDIINRWINSPAESSDEKSVWSEIDANYGNNQELKDAIWNIKYPQGKGFIYPQQDEEDEF